MKAFAVFAISGLAVAALAGPVGAAAQDAPSGKPAATAEAVGAEEKLDEALKRFGYLAGLARGCVVNEQQSALEREVLDLNASITRLFGVDRAFLFSSAFGYGTSVEVTTDECVEVMKNYELRVARHRAAAGGVK
jgi:hypothetical protein